VFITNETPANNSLCMPSFTSVGVTVNDSFGLTMNITWWGSSNNWSSWFILGNNTNVPNGTYSVPFSNLSILGKAYQWRVNATDSAGYWANESYVVVANTWLIPILQGDDGRLLFFVILFISASPLILLFIRRRRRRKRQRY
jgi:hypothetical protein